MKEHVASVANSVQEKAEHYAVLTKNPSTLISQVMSIGKNALLTQKFTPEQVTDAAAMMIAALAILEREKAQKGSNTP